MAGESPCTRNLSWPKGRGESQGSGWTQGLDDSFYIIMILPVHPGCVFWAHGRKGVGMQRKLKIGVSLPIPPRRASVCLLPAGLLRDLEEGSRPSLLPNCVWLCFCLSRSPMGTGRGRRAGEQWLILWEPAPAEQR